MLNKDVKLNLSFTAQAYPVEFNFCVGSQYQMTVEQSQISPRLNFKPKKKSHQEEDSSTSKKTKRRQKGLCVNNVTSGALGGRRNANQ